MKTKIFFLLCLAMVFSSCRKLIDIDPNYIGEWRGKSYFIEYSLIISEDGGAEYDRTIGGASSEGHEHWFGILKSSGKRFQIAYASPWFIILENLVLTDDDCTMLLGNHWNNDSIYIHNNWRLKFKYPKTIGYDGAEVVMYRHQY